MEQGARRTFRYESGTNTRGRYLASTGTISKRSCSAPVAGTAPSSSFVLLLALLLPAFSHRVPQFPRTVDSRPPHFHPHDPRTHRLRLRCQLLPLATDDPRLLFLRRLSQNLGHPLPHFSLRRPLSLPPRSPDRSPLPRLEQVPTAPHRNGERGSLDTDPRSPHGLGDTLSYTFATTAHYCRFPPRTRVRRPTRRVVSPLRQRPCVGVVRHDGADLEYRYGGVGGCSGDGPV